MPHFSVVLATYNRGVHILPTVRSVLAQTFQDFELLIVGDCCTDDTETVLRPFLSDRVRWTNLPERGGSQSLPNNAGIDQSSGDYIAYIGHDDLWAPDHLERLAELFRNRPDVDFGVAGCICHAPPGVRYWLFSGLFDDDNAKFEYFFPPSSFAHSRQTIRSIGRWRNAFEIRAPVDADLLLRAARAGLTFASTQAVTVHKFAATFRYLSYVRQESDEQVELLARMNEPGFNLAVATIVDVAKRDGSYMIAGHYPYENYAPGELASRNAQNKGIVRPLLQPFSDPVVIVQDNGFRALDWRPFDAGEARFRWPHLNPRPKILIPYTSNAPVRLRLQVAHQNSDVLTRFNIEMNGKPLEVRMEWLHKNGALWEATATMTASLSEAAYSIAVLILPEAPLQGGEAGIGVAEIALDALPPGLEAPPKGFDEMAADRLFDALSRQTATLEEITVAHAASQQSVADLNTLRQRDESAHAAETALLRQRVSGMKMTLSWRLTAPFREMRRAVRRLFGRSR